MDCSFVFTVKHTNHWPDFFLYSLVFCTSSVDRTCFLCLDCPAFRLWLQHTTQTSMPPAGIEPAIPASGRQQATIARLPGSAGFDPRTVQPVRSRYSDWAISTHIMTVHSSSHFGVSHSIVFLIRNQDVDLVDTDCTACWIQKLSCLHTLQLSGCEPTSNGSLLYIFTPYETHRTSNKQNLEFYFLVMFEDVVWPSELCLCTCNRLGISRYAERTK